MHEKIEQLYRTTIPWKLNRLRPCLAALTFCIVSISVVNNQTLGKFYRLCRLCISLAHKKTVSQVITIRCSSRRLNIIGCYNAHLRSRSPKSISTSSPKTNASLILLANIHRLLLILLLFLSSVLLSLPIATTYAFGGQALLPKGCPWSEILAPLAPFDFELRISDNPDIDVA